jgi:salicylate hydroxylase
MAVEDAAVLGSLLSRLSHISGLTPLIRGYEALRHARTAATQASSRLNQRIFHYPDGPEQEARDASMRMAMEYAKRVEERAQQQRDGKKIAEEDDEGGVGKGNYNQWADPQKNMEQFAYDADEEAEKWWKEKGDRVCKHAMMAGVVSARM